MNFQKLNERMELDRRQGIAGKTLAAFDCETTGSALFHGVLPFMVCVTFENREQLTFEWDVDPFTRIPEIDPGELAELIELLMNEDYLWVGHNIKFDVRCIEKAWEFIEGKTSTAFTPLKFLRRSHDTMLMSHALDNKGSHGLKDLAVRYLDIAEEDVALLKQQVEAARAFGRQQGWKIASIENCPYELEAPSGGWWIIDMWMPKAMYLEEACRGHLLPGDDFDNICKKYCLRDTERTILLFSLLREELNKEGLWDQYLRNQCLLDVTYDMERYGVSIHMDTLLSEKKRFTQLSKSHEAAALKACDIDTLNINAPEQVALCIQNIYNFNIQRTTKKGSLTVNKDEMEILYSKLEHALSKSKNDRVVVVDEKEGRPVANLYPRKTIESLMSFLLNTMASKKCRKTANGDLENYKLLALGYGSIDGLDIEYYLHGSINLTGADTTRISMSAPNLTNISKGKAAFNEDIRELDLSLRKIFGPTEGRKWWSIDYKQLQLVIAATISNEKDVIDVIKSGGDLHDMMHRKLAERLEWEYIHDDDAQRTIAKNTNFGFWFGAGPTKIDKTTHTSGLHPILCEMFPNAQTQIRKDIQQAQEIGYVTASGYRLYLPSDAPYAATVYKVQSWEGCIAKTAMDLTYRYTRNNASEDIHLILCVHDELVFDVPIDCDNRHLFTLMSLMEEAGRLEGITCQTDAKIITTNWAEGKKVERDRVMEKLDRTITRMERQVGKGGLYDT